MLKKFRLAKEQTHALADFSRGMAGPWQRARRRTGPAGDRSVSALSAGAGQDHQRLVRRYSPADYDGGTTALSD